MRYAVGHRAETKARILHAAGRRFRALGYGGIGIDGLAREAGVTSGAFYGHFRSKAEAFQEAVVAGMAELQDAIAAFKSDHGPAGRWIKPFVAFYFGPKLQCEMAEGCALPSLSPEVSRADIPAREAFEAELSRAAAMIAEGLPEGHGDRADTAWIMLALMSGGTTLARAVRDERMAIEITQAVARAVEKLAEGVRPSEPAA